MKLSYKEKILLISLIMCINIILRYPVVPHENGIDSFFIHVMTNSLNEFGFAKWFLHPLSIAGMYPASYTSSVQFLLSGISQSTSLEMNPSIFLYCIIIGVLSLFTSYLMAKGIYNDDLFKIVVALAFSTSPAVLEYTTWTIPTRGLLIVMAPLLIYLLLKVKSIKFVPLVFILSTFLFVTHHLFYFLIPVFFALFIVDSCERLNRNIKYTERLKKFIPLFSIVGFIFMWSVPFFTGHFIETSRYSLIDVSYIRYSGLLICFAAGGLFYLIFKQNKTPQEWIILLSLMFLTVFIYEQTYMKWFIPIFIIVLACIGLMNIIKLSENKKYYLIIFTIFLVLSTSFSAYYQFLHDYRESRYNARHIEESTYSTGRWMKQNINGVSIANDLLFGERIFSASETAHIFTDRTTHNLIYGFNSINISDYERYPLTADEFWFSGYSGPDIGEIEWERNHDMRNPSDKYNITYIVENRKAQGIIIWNHRFKKSKLLELAYGNNLIYDTGNINIWRLD